MVILCRDIQTVQKEAVRESKKLAINWCPNLIWENKDKNYNLQQSTGVVKANKFFLDSILQVQGILKL